MDDLKPTASTSPEPQPERQDTVSRVTKFVNRVSPRVIEPLAARKFLRRLVTVALWPSIDIIVTLFSNYLILRFNPVVATAATIAVMIVLNSALLYLLTIELDLLDWIRAKTRRLERTRRLIRASDLRRDLGILAVYTFSGPTMAGLPLIWVLRIKGVRAYTLVVIGTTLNGIFWVGAVYSSIWAVLREFFTFSLPF